jgi:hypothetical protein
VPKTVSKNYPRLAMRVRHTSFRANESFIVLLGGGVRDARPDCVLLEVMHTQHRRVTLARHGATVDSSALGEKILGKLG